MREAVAEAGPRIDIEQNIRDSHPGETVIGGAARDLYRRGRDRLQRRDHQPIFVEPDLR